LPHDWEFATYRCSPEINEWQVTEVGRHRALWLSSTDYRLMRKIHVFRPKGRE
jgi:hypothetical protein